MNQKTTIVLADDHPVVRIGVRNMLSSNPGFEVVGEAADGDEAITQTLELEPDILLLDLNMPVKGGWEAFDRLTSIHPLLQVIVITAQPDQYPRAAAAGVAALMEKPLDLPRLLRTIDILLCEPVEHRLSRLAGKHPITRYLRADM